jgi:N-hydroxyarylamine O-acetyltransferase
VTQPVDVAAYLRRIGLREARPDLETLHAIAGRHSANIPFENVDPWLGRPLPLDAASLQAKLVEGGRGGYCYEHNLLLRDALRAMGFRVTLLAARVMWNVPEGLRRPQTHALLRIDLEGERWLLDGGFGGMTPTAPLRLDDRAPQATPHERYRLVEGEGDVVLQAEVEGRWRPLYRFDEQPQHRVDCEFRSWHLRHHPESHFRLRLIAARTRADGRDALADHVLTRHFTGRASESTHLATAADIRQALAEVFGLSLQGLPGLDERLAAVARAGAG